MNELRKQIIHIINKTDDIVVLKDMLNLVNGVYFHYINGEWRK